MAVLQKGNSISPFWGENINLITGLDPLGLQVTSEATYSTLLPGISNLTNRLRYYGFYCWLINFYFQKEKKGQPNGTISLYSKSGTNDCNYYAI